MRLALRAALHERDGRTWRAALAPGEVHVWHADLERVPDALARALLSAAERERERAIVVPARRLRWGRSRALLRLLLACYLECDPRTLRLTTGAHGKPELAARRTALRFNLSHSGATAVYALALGRDVGVDVQLRAPAERLLALARRALLDGAAEALAEVGHPARNAAFLAAWTRREAELKCLGTGFAGARAPAPERFWTIPLALPGDGAAALCVRGRPASVRVRRWALDFG